jgi:hypothetical protein
VGTATCGVTLDSRLARPVDEATLSYKVKFSDGFGFVKGGKLPGLCSDGALVLSPVYVHADCVALHGVAVRAHVKTLLAPATQRSQLSDPPAPAAPCSHTPRTSLQAITTLFRVCADCPSGCQTVTANDGWSTRIMWRVDGQLESYNYNIGKVKPCGDSFPFSRNVEPGQWFDVVLYVKMNTPGASNILLKAATRGHM